MSKIGKKNIILPKDSSIKIDKDKLIISGPKGSKELPNQVRCGMLGAKR